MSESHAEARRIAERFDGNENLYEQHGESWSPIARDAAKLARAYLGLLTEQDALREALEAESPRELNRLRDEARLRVLPTPKQRENANG